MGHIFPFWTRLEIFPPLLPSRLDAFNFPYTSHPMTCQLSVCAFSCVMLSRAASFSHSPTGTTLVWVLVISQLFSLSSRQHSPSLLSKSEIPGPRNLHVHQLPREMGHNWEPQMGFNFYTCTLSPGPTHSIPSSWSCSKTFVCPRHFVLGCPFSH